MGFTGLLWVFFFVGQWACAQSLVCELGICYCNLCSNFYGIKNKYIVRKGRSSEAICFKMSLWKTAAKILHVFIVILSGCFFFVTLDIFFFSVIMYTLICSHEYTFMCFHRSMQFWKMLIWFGKCKWVFKHIKDYLLFMTALTLLLSPFFSVLSHWPTGRKPFQVRKRCVCVHLRIFFFFLSIYMMFHSL